MKKNTGITLIEIIVAISLLTLILLAGGGIYISGWNMFRDAQHTAQSQRNAVLPMTHMAKNLQDAISFTVPAPTPNILQFVVYSANPPSPTITRRYIFQNNQIVYDPDTTDNNGNEQIIGTHIPSNQNPPPTATSPFAITHGGIVVTITITAEDNRDQGLNLHTISSTVEARYGATPPV